MEIVENTGVMREVYLESLNECFPGWGSDEAFTWAFDRKPFAAPVADLMTLSEQHELLAGSAVSYRRIRLADERSAVAGIMTGSWTLPAARGRGCFTRIIQESLRLAGNHGAELLLAFVTEENASARQLLRAGASTVSTRYLILPVEAGQVLKDKLNGKTAVPSEAHFLAWAHAREGSIHFSYDFKTWREQFLERPFPTRLVATPEGTFAVLEEHEEVWRIQALHAPGTEAEMMCSLGAQAALEGKRLFAFTMDLGFAASLEEFGFIAKPGLLTIHRVQGDRNESDPLSGATWTLESGDRM